MGLQARGSGREEKAASCWIIGVLLLHCTVHVGGCMDIWYPVITCHVIARNAIWRLGDVFQYVLMCFESKQDF